MNEPMNIPLSGLRGMIASKMTKSLSTTAQLTYCAEFDATRFIRKRREANEKSTIKIGYEDLFIQALANVLPRHTLHNGAIEANIAELSEQVHVSVAVALPAGLMAPTIFDVGSKSLPEISEARRDLVARAKSGKLTVPEMTGGTFTISNLGQTRVRYFTPILNTPQIAMLGIGTITERPVAENGNIVVKPMVGLSLTTDHRVVDGEPSGRFLTDLCEHLEGLLS